MSTPQVRTKSKKMSKRYGVLVNMAVVYQTDDLVQAIREAKRRGGQQIMLCAGDTQGERREKRSARAAVDTSVRQTVTRNIAVLRDIDNIGGEFFGVAIDQTGNSRAATVDLQNPLTFEIDESLDVTRENLWAALRDYGRDLTKRANTLRRQYRSGYISSSPVIGFCLMRGDQRVSDVVPDLGDVRSLVDVADDSTDIHAVHEDGTSNAYFSELYPSLLQ